MKTLFKSTLNYLEKIYHFSSFRGHSFWNIPIDSNSVVVDLGANLCDFSSEVKKRFECTVFPVEPNATLNPNDSYFLDSVDRLAITNGNGEVDFTISENSEASSLYSNLANLFGSTKTIKVKGMSLNEYLKFKEIEGSLSLLKVDIEGGEIDLLSKIPLKELELIDQMTVEFHSFLDPSLELEVIAIIDRISKSGFWVINCNHPYYDDVLFINKKLFKKYHLKCLDIFIMKIVYVIRGKMHELIGTHK
ncbi:MAG TPA: FkbM family methyltransferase [Nodularia sp. (in: cyanobacteria)]|nr:FkbM family methyltransferase [Nodularia sp. (in: cyanobacteria)]